MAECTECLEQVIGISENPCTCYNDGRNAEYSVSLSGYYMDNPDYGIPMSFPDGVHDDCEDNNAWELCDRMRTKGINAFVTDLQRQILQSRYIRKDKPWNGRIGLQEKASGSISAGQYRGLVIDPIKYYGTRIQINEIRLKAAGTLPTISTPITISFWTEEELELGKVTPVTPDLTGAWQNQGLAILKPTAPIKFDLIRNDGSPQRIFVLSTLDNWTPASTPIAIKGGCCGKKATNAPLASTWIKAGGVQGSDMFLHTETPNTTQAYGMQISASMSCATTWLCAHFDWCNDDWARVAAECILLYSIKQLSAYILQTDMANIYTAIRSEELIDKRTYADELLAERMPWLVQNLPHDASDCYTCRTSQRRRSALV